MAVAAVEIEAVDLLQIADLLQAGRAERRLSVEGVKDNSLEQIAQREVVIFGEPFEDFEEALLDPHAGLDALNGHQVIVCHRQPWYIGTMLQAIVLFAALSAHAGHVTLHASADAGFHLFTPTGEKLWAGPSWNPQRAGTCSGGDEEGMVFRNPPDPSLWIVTRYAPAQHTIDYLIISDDVLTRLHVEVAPTGEKESVATVTYEMTPRTPAGNELAEKHSAHFERQMQHWEKAMNGALEAAAHAGSMR